ncbi:uncharacterized protein BO87DRAFT_227252 [Aspergillus neoniger CBS 115656]|uniref:Uncharacterized protein n=1 Tax=Aspergillus neoniger (strain CBS 115656) TaxID=1448310 RepID=A0A318Z8P7_ASPNB|nr:hypothetical protein BO87DRAFT_227252 [Aspergillus neoniger CBS 115656]PYH36638.1 hypothetical protein BO87DRAFT_227252 [Aspergillus neoniger CBS 115656]
MGTSPCLPPPPLPPPLQYNRRRRKNSHAPDCGGRTELTGRQGMAIQSIPHPAMESIPFAGSSPLEIAERAFPRSVASQPCLFCLVCSAIFCYCCYCNFALSHPPLNFLHHTHTHTLSLSLTYTPICRIVNSDSARIPHMECPIVNYS